MSQEQAIATATDNLLEEERPVSPAPSYVSMESDRSKDEPLHFSKGEPGLLEEERPVSPAPSYISMESDRSKDEPLHFSKGEPGLLEEERPVSPAPSYVSMESDRSKDEPLHFSKGELGPPQSQRPVSTVPSSASMGTDQLKDELDSKDKNDKHKLTADLKTKILSQHEEELRGHETDTEIYEIKTVKHKKDKAQTYHTLFRKKREKGVRTVLMTGVARIGKPDVASQRKLKSQLKEQFARVSEGIDRQKVSALLNEIYTDLYIIEEERGEVNVEHESRQVQNAKFRPVTQETSIKYHDIFKSASGENKPIRTVLTIGVAGIGKTIATMKYMLDWAEGTANTDIFYIFPLSFRELNLRKEEEHSLEELINHFCPGMETSEIIDYDKYRILIVLDGLDECHLDLDFSESNCWKDVRRPTSVNVLLTNLIQGELLSKAQIWITSRPAASNHIPADKVDRVTEVRGFNDEQKEEYFRKRVSDKVLAEKILSHVKKSRSLYIMCHIPVFCWITAKVLEDFVNRNKEETMPKTLTDMYIYFILLQCRQANVKYGGDETGESSETDSCWNTTNKETILSLGKLAFEGLEEGTLLFTEEKLTECSVDIANTAVFSGLFTQITRASRVLYQQKLFCFVHLSIQEFLAAFYVFHTFSNRGENVLTIPASTVANLPASDFYKTAVDKTLDSKNGDWDLVLRFLLGLSLETNQNLLQELLKKQERNEETNRETIGYIKEKIREESSDADKKCNLFHCLNELNDHSLVEEVKNYLNSNTLTFENFSASQWSALTFVLLTSDEKLDEFDLKKYLKSEKVLLGMLPVVKVSKTALLSWCELSEESCKGLSSSVLNSASSNLTQLDLSHNDILDSGVQRLADGLKSLHCKLEILKLSGCQVTEKGCLFLASALKSKMTSLKQLDLSYNHPGANGATTLSAVVADPNMSLKTLCLDHGGEHRLKAGLKKYLKLDENTASRRLVLSEGNRKGTTVQRVEDRVPRPENRDRFKRTQVFCEEGLRGLCYFEVEWKGRVGIAVAYKDVGRKWDSNGGLGCNEFSWSLLCSRTGYTARHGKTSTSIQVPHYPKIAVFLDWEGGTLTYYGVTSGQLSLIHTFHAKFTEPLFPGFWFQQGSVTLCEID
ncbi:NLR family CARD domain-containing protein 3-like [Enoplosus armatus]|uniref:NLR family CARD domain-containing protein 3-like n=1 Tax=Enoplosus armatus TaxID=215367 RepID=UPI00399610AD